MMYSTWRENIKLATTHVLTAAIIFSSLGGVIRAQKSTYDLIKDAPAPEITVACSETSFVFEGDDGDGPDGNIRTFNAAAMSVKASAFSRRVDNGQWQTAFLGAFGPGLGVTDQGEGDGSNGTHRIDNVGDRKNYVLLEFNTPIAVDKVFLDSVEQDSDITVWIGNANDPYNNHITLSDAVLSGFGPSEDNDTTSTVARNADINSTLEVGNVIVIAASTSDTTPEDQFKLHYLDVKCPNAQPPCNAGDMKTTGNSPDDGPDGNVRNFTTGGTVTTNARAFSRRKSDGLWETAYLGAFAAGSGVTDVGEGTGANNTKKVDNIGDRLNYVVFEFNQNVVIDEVYLDGVVTDSDITVWIGTAGDPYNNPITLSDSVLTSFEAETNNAPDNLSRWADINAAGEAGNVLIIAAKVNEANDTFLIEDLRINCPQPIAQVTIIEEVINPSGASTTSFGFTQTNFGTNFSLVDNNVTGPDRKKNYNITSFGAGNAITVTQSNTLGWTLDSVSCVETGVQNSTTNLANKKATIIPEPGESIVCTFRNAQLTPSAANAPISGRAVTTEGSGISQAVLTLTNVETGETQTTITNSFGYFNLEAPIGSFYTLTISHKRYFFADNVRTFTLVDELSDIEFVQSF